MSQPISGRGCPRPTVCLSASSLGQEPEHNLFAHFQALFTFTAVTHPPKSIHSHKPTKQRTFLPIRASLSYSFCSSSCQSLFSFASFRRSFSIEKRDHSRSSSLFSRLEYHRTCSHNPSITKTVFSSLDSQSWLSGGIPRQT